jgi:hypothetical protein
MAGALKDALNEVLTSVVGNEARVCVWKYLRECHGMTADDLNTVEKMQQALQLVFGSMAKPLASVAFAQYMVLLH